MVMGIWLIYHWNRTLQTTMQFFVYIITTTRIYYQLANGG
jgi:hypothetical protein